MAFADSFAVAYHFRLLYLSSQCMYPVMGALRKMYDEENWQVTSTYLKSKIALLTVSSGQFTRDRNLDLPKFPVLLSKADFWSGKLWRLMVVEDAVREAYVQHI